MTAIMKPGQVRVITYRPSGQVYREVIVWASEAAATGREAYLTIRRDRGWTPDVRYFTDRGVEVRYP